MPLPGQVVISISSEPNESLLFAVVTDRGSFGRVVSRDLAATLHEDMRLLRWKAAGLQKIGDALLIDVGAHLAEFVLPSEERDQWGQIISDSPTELLIRFNQGTEGLLHLPWELFRVGDRFVLQESGSHVLREIRSAAPPRKAGGPFGILHISMGFDPVLRLDEERCLLLDELPEQISVSFLLNPMFEELGPVLARLKPQMIIISGHGRYRDIEDVHVMEGISGDVPTASLVRFAGLGGCQFLVLSTCEGARLSSSFALEGKSMYLPADVVSFTYPANSSTLLECLRALVRALLAGNNSADAIRDVRGIESDDEYSFFNIAHYHAQNQPFFQMPKEVIASAGSMVPSVGRSPRCGGHEADLLGLDKVANTNDVTTVIAPVGCEAEAVISHWHSLNSRSAFGQSVIYTPETLQNAIDKIPPRTKWVILDDPSLSLDPSTLPGPSVRTVATYRYEPCLGDEVVPVEGMDLSAARRFAQSILGARAADIQGHPLETVPGVVRGIAGGLTADQATTVFEADNQMQQRFDSLSGSGRLYASFMFTMHGESRFSGEDGADHFDLLRMLGFDSDAMKQGLNECLKARIVFRFNDRLVMAGEYMLVGKKWFSSWREDSRVAFLNLCSAFFTLNASGTLDISMGETLLGWAIAAEQWREAGALCVAVSGWYGQHGRLPELQQTIMRIVPHVDGMPHVVLTGHLASILSLEGRFAEALVLHREDEMRLRHMPHDDDYFRNLTATLMQQVDCCLECDQVETAQQKWMEARTTVDSWPEANPEVRARLIAQHAQIHRELHNLDAAVAEMTAAIGLAQQTHCPPMMIAELFQTRCDYLRLQGKIDAAERDLLAIEPVDADSVLYPRYLHLKGLLLEARSDPSWINHILQSYEHDLQANNIGGVIISLLTIARIFLDQGEVPRAKARLKQVFPYIEHSGLESAMGTFSLLWGEVEIAEGSNGSAKEWLFKARTKLDGADDQAQSERVTRLLAKLN